MSARIRIGTITDLDNFNDRGVIQDENEQEIDFMLSEVDIPLELGQQVSFSIKLVNHKLMATGINILLAILALTLGLDSWI